MSEKYWEKYFTVEPNFIEVSKKEFKEFIKNYPRELDEHWICWCTPPCVDYNDLELAEYWPATVVAAISMEGIHRILENYEECFKSKIKEVD